LEKKKKNQGQDSGVDSGARFRGEKSYLGGERGFGKGKEKREGEGKRRKGNKSSKSSSSRTSRKMSILHK